MSSLLEFLQDTQRLSDAIDDEIDAYIATFTEKTEERRELAKIIFEKKQIKTAKIARGIAEKYRYGRKTNQNTKPVSE